MTAQSEDRTTAEARARAPMRASRWTLRATVGLIWLLGLTSYAPAGRSAPLEVATLDWVGAMKVATRVAALGILAMTLASAPRTRAKRDAVRCLLPFVLYASWATITSLWAAYGAVALGHAVDLFLLLMLAAAAALAVADDANVPRLLFHLASVMLIAGVMSVLLAFAGPPSPVFNSRARPGGFLHPNLAAQSAGGAFLIVLAGVLGWRWRWSRRLMPPGALLAGYVLYAAHSRTAIASTLLAAAACLFFLGRRRLLLVLGVSCVLLAAVYLALDPHGDVLSRAGGEVSSYVLRGQTDRQFMSATGRMEMWRIGAESFLRAPLFGHGHWMASEDGVFLIWGQYQYQTLHNLALHVLAGSGIVGGVLILWALARPLALVRHGLRGGRDARVLAAVLLVLFGWFLVIGLYELSFLGPVSPVSVLFFVLLGLAAGRLGTSSEGADRGPSWR